MEMMERLKAKLPSMPEGTGGLGFAVALGVAALGLAVFAPVVLGIALVAIAVTAVAVNACCDGRNEQKAGASNDAWRSQTLKTAAIVSLTQSPPESGSSHFQDMVTGQESSQGWER